MSMTLSTHRAHRLAAIVLFAAILTGCSGTRTYQATSDNNLRFTTVTESGSWFSTVRAQVHIHSVDRNCQTKYQGTIALRRDSLKTGIPAGQRSYLVFAFNSSAFLSNRTSSVSYRTLLTPRRGRDYRIEVKYIDDSYDATIHEVHPRSRKSRKIHHAPLDSCRSASWKKTGK